MQPNNGSGYSGAQELNASSSEFNAQSFLIQSALARVRTMTVVKVVGVTNAGGLAATGFVDIQPLVNQVDGAGNAVPHGTIFKCPYIRMQGGANAIILDPQVGDIGWAGFADRDISSVTANQAQSNPGSRRMFDMADGVYIGAILNGVPTQYVQFSAAGIAVTSPTAVTVNAPNVTVNATTATINAAGAAIISAASITLKNTGAALKTLLNSTLLAWLESHVHGNGNGGANTTAPTTVPASTTQTSIVQAE